MEIKGITVVNINGKMIAIKGIGRLFFQQGLPISIAVSELKKKDIEVSILHVADECLKNGWSPKTTFHKIKADFEEDIENNNTDFEMLEKFCNADYEQQRDMIFKYLFKTKEVAEEILRNNFKNLTNERSTG